MRRLPVHNPHECGKIDSLTIPETKQPSMLSVVVDAVLWAAYVAVMFGSLGLLVWLLKQGN